MHLLLELKGSMTWVKTKSNNLLIAYMTKVKNEART